MAENNVDIVTTIRLRSDQLRADKEKAKGEFADLKKEAEKPVQTQVTVETAQAEKSIAQTGEKVTDTKAEIAKPVPLVIDPEPAEKVLTDMRARMAQMREELAVTAQNLNERQTQVQQEIAAGGGPGIGGGGRGRRNDVNAGLAESLRVIIAIQAALSAVEVSLGAWDELAGAIQGDTDRIAKGSEAAKEAIKEIPLIGHRFVSIVEKIHELVTGDQAAAARTIEEAKSIDKKTESLRKQADEMRRLADEIRGRVDAEKAAALADARKDFTPGQQKIASTVDELNALRARQAALKAQGKDLADFADLEKALVERLDREKEEEARDHEKKLAQVEAEGQEARLRAAGKSRAAERSELERHLQDRIDAEKDAGVKVELERQKPQKLADFDKETRDKKAAEEAKEFERQSKEANAVTDKIAAEAKRRAEAQIKANQKAQEEIKKSNERAADLREDTRERELRQAGKNYEADVAKFTDAADKKIKRATTDAERQAAIADKASGLRALALDHAKDMLKFRSPEELSNQLQQDISAKALAAQLQGPQIPEQVTAKAANLGSGVGKSGGPNSDGNQTEKKQLTALEKLVEFNDPSKAQRVQVYR